LLGVFEVLFVVIFAKPPSRPCWVLHQGLSTSPQDRSDTQNIPAGQASLHFGRTTVGHRQLLHSVSSSRGKYFLNWLGLDRDSRLRRADHGLNIRLGCTTLRVPGFSQHKGGAFQSEIRQESGTQLKKVRICSTRLSFQDVSARGIFTKTSVAKRLPHRTSE